MTPAKIVKIVSAVAMCVSIPMCFWGGESAATGTGMVLFLVSLAAFVVGRFME